MNVLLVFFALPVATILISIVLEKILKSPILVAIFVFAVFLIVAFAAFDANFLIAAIIYTILAFITAAIVKLICHFIRSSENAEIFNFTNDLRNNNRNNLRDSNNRSRDDTFENDNIIKTHTNTSSDANSLNNILSNRRRRSEYKRL